jgi:hypothetical protein
MRRRPIQPKRNPNEEEAIQPKEKKRKKQVQVLYPYSPSRGGGHNTKLAHELTQTCSGAGGRQRGLLGSKYSHCKGPQF